MRQMQYNPSYCSFRFILEAGKASVRPIHTSTFSTKGTTTKKTGTGTGTGTTGSLAFLFR